MATTFTTQPQTSIFQRKLNFSVPTPALSIAAPRQFQSQVQSLNTCSPTNKWLWWLWEA